jgi:hypothetical protein
VAQYSLARQRCPVAEACVVTAIADDLKILASPAAGEAERLAALKYLGHWLGDIHQPLHVSFADDRAGSDIAVAGLCSGTIHAAWDGCLIERSLGRDTQAVATALHAEISDEERAAWTASTPLAWGNESLAIAISPTIRYCHWSKTAAGTRRTIRSLGPANRSRRLRPGRTIWMPPRPSFASV